MLQKHQMERYLTFHIAQYYSLWMLLIALSAMSNAGVVRGVLPKDRGLMNNQNEG